MRKDYGNKRDYPKLDIYVAARYVASTTWAKNCAEAVEAYKLAHKQNLYFKNEVKAFRAS